MYYIKRPDDLTLLKYKMILKQSEFSYNDEVVSFSINSGVTLTGVNNETGEEFSIPISEFKEKFTVNGTLFVYANVSVSCNIVNICSFDCYNSYLNVTSIVFSDEILSTGYSVSSHHLYYNGRYIDTYFDDVSLVALNHRGTSAILCKYLYMGNLTQLTLVYKDRVIKDIKIVGRIPVYLLSKGTVAINLLEEMKRLE